MKTKLSDQAYETILNKIITTEYAPGSAINELSLVTDLGISRTPIHSAMLRLQQEKLIKIINKKGIVISPIDATTIKEIYDIREVIEVSALKRYGSDISKNDILNLLDIFSLKTTDVSTIYKSDSKLHLMIVNQTNNCLLIEWYNSLYNHFSRISHYCGTKNPSRIEQSRVEHSAILRSIFNDNIEEAVTNLKLHLSYAREAAYNSILNSHNE